MSGAIGVDATMSQIYVHHEISCAPRHWSEVAEQVQNSSYFKNADGNASLLGFIFQPKKSSCQKIMQVYRFQHSFFGLCNACGYNPYELRV